MFERIKKRNGDVVKFEANNITEAIFKAGHATGEFGVDVSKKLTVRVLDLAIDLLGEKIPSVEDIQDIVEEVLIASPYKKTAKSYIIYRDQHAKLREITTKANLDLVDNYLTREDWRVNENSNMSFSLQGLNNYVSSEITKTYWLNSIYPPEIRLAYINGDIHIHDMGCLAVYCVGWDLQDLLTVGFKGAMGKVESKPAKHFRTVLGQIVNFFYTLQGEAAGAQSFSNFDTLLAPFIRYDGLTYKEVHQALQEFVFNVNVPTRVGFQTPFSNLTLDLTVPSIYKDQPVIIGGKLQDKTYKEFQKEMDILNRAFLEVMLAGDAKGRVFTFPIPTYNITKDFDWNNSNIDLLWQVTSKYGIPYFSNFIHSDMSPDDVRSMCCRLRLDTTELKKRGGGLFGANPLTGSVGVVTINMPRLGYLAESKEEFIQLLEQRLYQAKESLEIKRKIIEKFTDEDLYPYSKFYLRNVKQRFGKYWTNHFSTIGIIGMNEACLNLIGSEIGTKQGTAFASEVMHYIRKKLVLFQEETGHRYNLEATPAEGTSYRLAKADKAKYPGIICAAENAHGGSGEPFYTNSTHLPVNYTDDLFESLELQDDIQSLYTGGTVVHLFTGEAIDSNDGVKRLVKVICDNFKLPYFTITPTFSVCPQHGYIKGEEYQCEKCGEDTEVYSRVVGYLRPVQQWNKGKKQEFRTRKTYIVK